MQGESVFSTPMKLSTTLRETRGRKPLEPGKRRERACYTLPTEMVRQVQRIAGKTCDVPASRFVEFAIDVALRSVDDPDYIKAVKEAAKKK